MSRFIEVSDEQYEHLTALGIVKADDERMEFYTFLNDLIKKDREEENACTLTGAVTRKYVQDHLPWVLSYSHLEDRFCIGYMRYDSWMNNSIWFFNKAYLEELLNSKFSKDAIKEYVFGIVR